MYERTLALMRRHPSRSAALGVLAAWAGVAAWLAADFSGRIRDWSVMTDEMLYTKLAISIADTGSPLPRVHDVLVGVLNQFYPLLLAPFFAGFAVPDASHAAHVFNAPLMASAVIPAYLLARQVVPRVWSLAVSVLSVTVPWMVLTGVLMTESVAYPVFLWAMLACLHAIRRPSPQHDLLALAALVLAVLARTQFVALAVVLPLAVLADSFALIDGASTRKRIVGGVRVALERHPLLAAGYAAAAVLAGVVAAFYSLGDALGVYSTTLHGSILPSGVWQSAAAHLDAVAIGCGLVPLLLGGGWMLAAAARPSDRKSFSFAVLGLLTIAALTLETASFDLRFGGAEIVRDRYLFYIVPLLLIGTAAALADVRRRSVAYAAAALTVFFAATVHLLPFPTGTAFWVDSPARVLNGSLADASGSLATATFVAFAGACLGLAVLLGYLLLPGRALGVVVLAFLLPFTVLTTRTEIDSVAAGTSSSGRPLTGPPGRRARLDRQRASRRPGGSDGPVSTVAGVRARRRLLVGRRVLEQERRPDVRLRRQGLLLRAFPRPETRARLDERSRPGHRARSRLRRLRTQRSPVPASRHPPCREHRAGGDRRRPPIPRPVGNARTRHRRLGPGRETGHGPDLLAEQPGGTRPPRRHAGRASLSPGALSHRRGRHYGGKETSPPPVWRRRPSTSACPHTRSPTCASRAPATPAFPGRRPGSTSPEHGGSGRAWGRCRRRSPDAPVRSVMSCGEGPVRRLCRLRG